MASDLTAAALKTDPTPKTAAPSPMAYFREMRSLTLPASMPVKADGTRMIWTGDGGFVSGKPTRTAGLERD